MSGSCAGVPISVVTFPLAGVQASHNPFPNKRIADSSNIEPISVDAYRNLRYCYCNLRWANGAVRRPSRNIHMKLGEKIRYLREVEGSLRGMNRAMSQQELVRAIDAETGSKLSQSYLSQIESGARPHLTNTTRQL